MGGIITTQDTQELQKVVQQVVNNPELYRGSELLPAVSHQTFDIYVDVIKATGGLTQAHRLGTDTKYITAGDVFTQQFSPPTWREAIHWGEDNILKLRKLGANDRSQRGIRMYLDKAVDRLNRRIEARMEKLRWDTIFNGGYSWFDASVSFGVPSANRALPIGAVWSSDGINANNSADPIKDIRYWVSGGLAAFRKYRIARMWMNPNTARWILDNTNTRAYLTSFGANPALTEYGIEKTLSFLIPGCPVPVVYDGWFQDETINVDGVVTVGDAQYFIPDGFIFFDVTNLPGGDKLGEMVVALNLQNGTIDEPGTGKFLLVEDNTAPGTQGGPKNPFIDIVAGFNGGPKLDRPFDLLTAKVVS